QFWLSDAEPAGARPGLQALRADSGDRSGGDTGPCHAGLHLRHALHPRDLGVSPAPRDCRLVAGKARCLEQRSAFSRSNTPCRMKAAAAESIRVSRFFRDTSISSSARSAATVESLSSQKAKGRSVRRAMLRTKARDACARGPSLPSMLTGSPMTTAPTVSRLQRA